MILNTFTHRRIQHSRVKILRAHMMSDPSCCAREGISGHCPAPHFLLPLFGDTNVISLGSPGVLRSQNRLIYSSCRQNHRLFFTDLQIMFVVSCFQEAGSAACSGSWPGVPPRHRMIMFSSLPTYPSPFLSKCLLTLIIDSVHTGAVLSHGRDWGLGHFLGAGCFPRACPVCLNVPADSPNSFINGTLLNQASHKFLPGRWARMLIDQINHMETTRKTHSLLLSTNLFSEYRFIRQTAWWCPLAV